MSSLGGRRFAFRPRWASRPDPAPGPETRRSTHPKPGGHPRSEEEPRSERPAPGRSVFGNRSSSRTCAASRMGSPPGYARSLTSSPTAAPILTRWWTWTISTWARSIRATCDREIPHVRPTAESDSPAPTRARRSSSPTLVRSERARRSGRAVTRSLEGTAPVCRTPLNADLAACRTPAERSASHSRDLWTVEVRDLRSRRSDGHLGDPNDAPWRRNRPRRSLRRRPAGR